MLSQAEKERYNRHLIIPQFTELEQQKLQNAAILVIGAGGLGSPVLQYLCAAGVGKIGIVDTDVVAISNLQRQILYTEKDEGKIKADIAASKLKAMNSACTLQVYKTWWTAESAEGILSGYDLIIDCTDNFESRLTTDIISAESGIPWIYGAINGWQGQVSVFNYNGSKSYRSAFDISESNIPERKGPIGVIGVTPAVVGSLQAAEAIKLVIGQGKLLTDKVLIISLKSMDFKVMGY